MRINKDDMFLAENNKRYVIIVLVMVRNWKSCAELVDRSRIIRVVLG